MKRLACLAGLLLAVACSKSETENVAPTATPTSTAPATAAAPAEPADELEEIETQEDFEEEALHEISAENFEAELDKLEAEIGN